MSFGDFSNKGDNRRTNNSTVPTFNLESTTRITGASSRTSGPTVIQPTSVSSGPLSISHPSSSSSAAQDKHYNDLWDKCSHSVFVISNNVASIQKSANLLGNKLKDTPEMRQRLHDLQEETRHLIKETSIDMKTLTPSSQSDEHRSRKLAQEKLQKDFESVLKRFQAVSKLIAEKSREYVSRAKAQHERELAMQDDDDSRETVPLLVQEQSNRLHALDNEIEYNEALIEEREADLVEIERSIAEVNEIFRDLGTLVHEQQYMLDHIESNVDTVAINMENATGELQKASDYQKRYRKRMCWFFFLCLLVALIISIILFS